MEEDGIHLNSPTKKRIKITATRTKTTVSKISLKADFVDFSIISSFLFDILSSKQIQ